MSDPARYRRIVAAAALVAAPVLSAVSVSLQPELSGSATARLAAIDAAGPAAAVSAAFFVLAQLPTLVALLAVGHLLRDRAPKLSSAVPTVGGLGAFGHAVFGGVMLVTVVLAGRPGPRGPYAGVLGAVEASPVMSFAALGLVGTVVGTLLMAAGLFRGKVGPAWVPAALVVFVLVEFAGGALLGRWGSVLSCAIYLLALAALVPSVLADRAPLRAESVRGMVFTDS
jgi:hypothetical protein